MSLTFHRLIPFLGALVLCGSLISCQAEKTSSTENINPENTENIALACAEEVISQAPEKKKAQHPYGAWYCPDNLHGFPPMDIQDAKNLEVIEGRLPTQEEARSGQSLIFVDSEKHPTAKALDIPLPQVGKYYNEHSQKDELVIVIQAIVVDQDSVLGFRYANGGNGSARLSEVEFLQDLEVQSMGAQPFVSKMININAPREKVWKTLTGLEHEKTLMASLGSDAFLTRAWQPEAKVEYPHHALSDGNIGKMTIAWDGVYAQIDYKIEGENYVQKFFINENEEAGVTEVHIVAGPHKTNYEEHRDNWSNFLTKIQELSERYQKGDPSLMEEVFHKN